MKNIFKVITRELKYIWHKKNIYVLLVLIFPITDFLFLGGICIAGSLTELPIAVIDNDNSKLSRNIIRYFDASADMEVKYRVNNVEELNDLFATQKAVLGLYIPRDLQKNIKKQNPQSVTIFTNGSNYVMGNIADLDATTIIATLGAGIKYKTLTKKGFSSQQAKTLIMPIQTDTAKLFNPALNYNDYLTPGLWLSVIHQLLILFGTLTISKEFDLKTITRVFKTAGDSVFKVLVGKTVVYMAFGFMLLEILYRIIFPIFSIKIIYSTTAAMLLSICFSFAAISLGLLLSSVLRTRLNALKGCLLISAPAFLLSGYTWPLYQMPAPIRTFVQIIPITPFLEGFRKIYQQNLGLEFVFPFALHLIILGIIFFVLSNIITSIRIKRFELK